MDIVFSIGHPFQILYTIVVLYAIDVIDASLTVD